MRSRLFLILPAIAALALIGCGDQAANVTPPTVSPAGAPAAIGEMNETPTIYQIAKAASESAEPEFTILVAALEATGLDAALDGKGQFTVFAPTDAAFGRLFSNPDFPYTPEEVLANTELLSTVLLYHVARGNRPAEDVVDASRLRMMAAGFTFVEIMGMDAYLRDGSAITEDAQIVAVDIMASNGVIHVIDEVLLP